MPAFDFEVPEKCRTCPHLRAVPAELSQIEQQRNGLNGFAEILIGGLPEELTSDFATHLEHDHGLPAEEVSSALHDMEMGTRKQVADQLNELDARIDEVKHTAAMKVERCAGTLSLPGTRDNQEYTVKVCGSTFHHNENNPVPAELTIRQK